MPISHTQKIIFIHVPKNAGTSIVETLNMERDGHVSAKTYYKSLGEHLFNEYFKFAFSRNPWDRFVSAYEYAKMEKSYVHSTYKHPDYDTVKNLSFIQVARLLPEGILKHPGWKNQYGFITIDNSIEVNRIYKYETDIPVFEKDFNVSLKNINKSTREIDYRRYYNDETIDIIKNFYKKDIELFNYEY